MVARMVYLKNVTTLSFDPERCVGCGMCLIVCPQGVFGESNGRPVIAFKDACMECGACSQNCPTGAVSVRAGVGCAAAIINGLLGRESSGCCCVVEARPKPAVAQESSEGKQSTGCC